MARFSRAGTWRTGRSGAVRGEPAQPQRRTRATARRRLELMAADGTPFPGPLTRERGETRRGSGESPPTRFTPLSRRSGGRAGRGAGGEGPPRPPPSGVATVPPPPAILPLAMPAHLLRFDGLSRRFGRLAVLAGVSAEA